MGGVEWGEDWCAGNEWSLGFARDDERGVAMMVSARSMASRPSSEAWKAAPASRKGR